MQILSIMDNVNDALRSIGASLCKLIYWLIASLYDLFINVSSVKFLTDENIKPIYQRITLILSIVMVFYVTFMAVRYIVEPDTMTDKEKGTNKIVSKMIIVVLLIAMVPQIFSLAYTLQNSLIKNEIFSVVFLGKKSASVTTYGRSFSANMFGLFYFVDDELWKEDYSDINDMECEDPDVSCVLLVNATLSSLANRGHLDYVTSGLNSAKYHKDDTGEKVRTYCITFQGWLAIGVGLFICYMLLLYCIDAGTRVAQLAFLQIIAPIPIIGYLTPKKDGIFDKWVKQCLTTYIDLFLRMSIIYTILLMTEILGDAYRKGTLFNEIGDVSPEMRFFIYIVLVLGLLAFAKRAPKMMQELFPKMGAASGTLGLGLKDRTEGLTNAFKGANKLRKGVGKYVGYGNRVAGGAAGFLAGGIRGRSFGAAVAGAKKGADKNGKGLYKRIKSAGHTGRKVRENRADVKSAGGTVWGSEHRQEHYQNVAQRHDRRVNQLEQLSKHKKIVSENISGLKFMKSLSAQDEAINKISPAAASEWGVAKKDIEKLSRRFASGEITDANEFRRLVSERVNRFNANHNANAYINTGTGQPDPQTGEIDYGDLEIGTANWTSIETEINAARRVATELRENGGETFTIINSKGERELVNDNFIFNDDTFAADLGTESDNANALAGQIKNSVEYKRAHTNAQGSKNDTGGKK